MSHHYLSTSVIVVTRRNVTILDVKLKCSSNSNAALPQNQMWWKKFPKRAHWKIVVLVKVFNTLQVLKKGQNAACRRPVVGGWQLFPRGARRLACHVWGLSLLKTQWFRGRPGDKRFTVKIAIRCNALMLVHNVVYDSKNILVSVQETYPAILLFQPTSHQPWTSFC